MKRHIKLICLILILSFCFSFASCSRKPEEKYVILLANEFTNKATGATVPVEYEVRDTSYDNYVSSGKIQYFNAAWIDGYEKLEGKLRSNTDRDLKYSPFCYYPYVSYYGEDGIFQKDVFGNTSFLLLDSQNYDEIVPVLSEEEYLKKAQNIVERYYDLTYYENTKISYDRSGVYVEFRSFMGDIPSYYPFSVSLDYEEGNLKQFSAADPVTNSRGESMEFSDDDLKNIESDLIDRTETLYNGFPEGLITEFKVENMGWVRLKEDIPAIVYSVSPVLDEEHPDYDTYKYHSGSAEFIVIESKNSDKLK